MKNFCLISCLLLIATIAAAADTKTATSPEGKCAVTVPSTWTTDSLGGVESPDKKISAIVRSPKHGLTSLADVKQAAPGIYKDDKVTKDTASDFQMEGKSLNGKPNFYRAIPAGAQLCILEVTYENPASAPEAKAVTDSLKAK
jgi:hypothetical protein